MEKLIFWGEYSLRMYLGKKNGDPQQCICSPVLGKHHSNAYKFKYDDYFGGSHHKPEGFGNICSRTVVLKLKVDFDTFENDLRHSLKMKYNLI